MATIRDVARKAKVAPSTVSMVINGRGKVSAPTRERIEAAMDETKYRRRDVGRPLARPQASANIAVIYARRVVFNGMMCSLGRQWIAGIREVARETHSHLTLTPAVEDAETDEMFQQALSAGEVDGAIFIGITGVDGGPYLNRALDAGVPAVVFNRKPLHDEFSYVAMDNYGAGCNAVDHLVKLGHRRIAVAYLNHPDRRYVAELGTGAEASLTRHDLSPVYRGLLTETACEDEIAEMCRAVVASGATGIYLGVSDGLVVRCLNAWDALGVNIPERLSVVGFEDVGPKSARGLRPTSVGFDKKMMGREAMRMLLELVERRGDVRNKGLVVATKVVEHDTTGPAPKSEETRSPAARQGR
jgi:DNA-binding LacI/PurR family transcriptional regulator